MKGIKFWNAVFSLLGLGLALLFLFKVWTVLVPFVLGLVIAYLIHPLVNRFVAMGLRRDRVVAVLYLILLAVVTVLGFILIPPLVREIGDLTAHLPAFASHFNQLINNLNAEIRHALQFALGRRAEKFAIPIKAENLAETVLSNLPGGLSNAAHIGLSIVIVPFVCFFALREGRKWIDHLFDLTPSRYVESLLSLLAELDATLGGYVRGQLLDAMCVGLFTILGLALLGFNGAVLMGVTTGFLNFIPYMAPIVGGSIALVAAYFQGATGTTLIGIVCLFVLVRMFDDFFFTPFVVGSSVQLHPIVMLFAILAGFEIGGILGLLFAIPVAGIIKVIFSILIHGRQERLLLERQHVAL